MSTLSLNEEKFTQYGTIQTTSTANANGYSNSSSPTKFVPNNGCVKCRLEQMARRWSQGDLSLQTEGAANPHPPIPWRDDRNGWGSPWRGNPDLALQTHQQAVAQKAATAAADFPPDLRPCRGKYYLLRHGSSFYLLQFPCCRTR